MDSRLRLFYGGGKTALQSRQRSPCSAFLRVDGGSEWNFENEWSRAITAEPWRILPRLDMIIACAHTLA